MGEATAGASVFDATDASAHTNPPPLLTVPVRTVGDSSYRLRDLTLRFYDADALQPVDADVSVVCGRD